MRRMTHLKRMTGQLVLVGLILGAFSATATAQLDLSEDQQHLLLAARRTGTMEEELQEAAAAGFRVLAGAPTSGDEVVLILERTTDQFEYQLLATSRTSTMQEELDAAAAEGFRFLARTPLCKSRRLGGDEIVVVLERSPSVAQRYEYRLLATSRTSTLQAEISEAVDQGFALSALVSCSEHMAVMERELP